MIKRIVKLTFREEACDDFVEVFEKSKQAIRAFPGCQYLELWRSKDQPNIFFTYSFWQEEAALEAYRHSDLFKNVWKQTKVLFSDKPEAWSVEMLDLIRPIR